MSVSRVSGVSTTHTYFADSSGRGLSAGFQWYRRSGSGSFAVRLAVDDELMSAMAEAIQSALAEQRFIKDGHPFLHAAIRRQDCRTSRAAVRSADHRSLMSPGWRAF